MRNKKSIPINYYLVMTDLSRKVFVRGQRAKFLSAYAPWWETGAEAGIKGERRYRARRGAAMIFKMLIADTNLSNYRVIMSSGSNSSSSDSISNSQAWERPDMHAGSPACRA
jgi:hypothetical protein